MPAPIASAEEFYAHALAIEREAAERYAEFAGHFEDRDVTLATLCRRLAALEREHFEELASACERLELPLIDVTEYCWIDGLTPEVPAREVVYRLTTPLQLLEIALEGELRAHAFFVEVARTAAVRGVRELAAVMAAEESEHVAWVRKAIDEAKKRGSDWPGLLENGTGPGIVSPD